MSPPTQMKRSVIATLEERRRELGMSCADVARRSGVSYHTTRVVLSQRRERRVAFRTVARIAATLGMKLGFRDMDDNNKGVV